MELLLQVVTVIGSISGLVIGIVMTVRAFTRDKTSDNKEQLLVNSDLEVKVKELEGKISAEYRELTTRLGNLERQLLDNKNAGSIFENRILASVDKIDAKMERIQDLVIKVIVNNPNNSK